MHLFGITGQAKKNDPGIFVYGHEVVSTYKKPRIYTTYNFQSFTAWGDMSDITVSATKNYQVQDFYKYDEDTFFALVDDLDTSSWALWVSTDGGQNWTAPLTGTSSSYEQARGMGIFNDYLIIPTNDGWKSYGPISGSPSAADNANANIGGGRVVNKDHTLALGSQGLYGGLEYGVRGVRSGGNIAAAFGSAVNYIARLYHPAADRFALSTSATQILAYNPDMLTSGAAGMVLSGTTAIGAMFHKGIETYAVGLTGSGEGKLFKKTLAFTNATTTTSEIGTNLFGDGTPVPEVTGSVGTHAWFYGQNDSLAAFIGKQDTGASNWGVFRSPASDLENWTYHEVSGWVPVGMRFF